MSRKRKLVTQCPSCGARVDAPPGPTAYVHPCRFCGAQIPIEPLEQAAPPPQIRIEIRGPGESPAAAAAVNAAQRTGRTLGCIITAATLIPVMIPLFIFVGPMLKSFVGARFGSFPVQVTMNDDLEIADRTATSDDTLVTVGINGKLTLRRCHLKGPLIVKAGVNAEITIIDSTLEATKAIVDADEANVVITIQNSTLTSAEEILDDGASNVKVSVSKDSKLTAQGIAIPVTNNGEVTIDHSTVEGKVGGVELKNNGKLKVLNGAVVKSDGPAVDLSLNGHLQVTSAHLESKTTALHAGQNFEGTLRSATLIGPRAAYDLGNNARVTVSQSTFNGPRKTGMLGQVDER
jgi:hypothetical protein